MANHITDELSIPANEAELVAHDRAALERRIAVVYNKSKGVQDYLRHTKPAKIPNAGSWSDEFIELRRKAIEAVSEKMPDWLQDLPNLLHAHEATPLNPDKAGGLRAVPLFVNEQLQFFVTAFVLGPKQETSVHNHDNSLFCSSTGVHGSYSQQTYSLKDGTLNYDAVTFHQANDTTTVGKYSDNDWHVLRNPNPEGHENTIRIHVYDAWSWDAEKQDFVSQIETAKANGTVATSVARREVFGHSIDPKTQDFAGGERALVRYTPQKSWQEFVSDIRSQAHNLEV